MEWLPETVVPAARSEGLVVEHLAGEALIYDLERDEAHNLNPTAAVVFALCDGRATVAGLASGAAERLRQPVSAQTVAEALELLAERNLLAGAPQVEGGVSRREVVRKAALVGAGAAAAAPLIKSIVAPTPAMAQTGQPCQGNADCPEGDFCMGENGDGRCVPCRGLGEECFGDNSCCGAGCETPGFCVCSVLTDVCVPD